MPASAGPSPRPSWPGERRDGRPSTSRRSSTPTAASGWCSPGAARGWSRRRWPPRAQPRPPGLSTGWWRGSGGTTSRSNSPTTASRSTRLATTRWPGSPSPGGSTRWPRPMPTTPAPRATGSPPPWPRCGPGAPSTRWTAGSRRALAFDLRLVAPGLPPFPVPEGLDEQRYLTVLVEEGAARRYGPRGAERVPGAWAQLDHELDVIATLGFAGYFLVVWDIVQFCRRQGIYCQGRGSAANSAVCFALGITNADAVRLGLLFERFLSPERDGPPDIDVDIESGRREEVIQYVYDRYGRSHAAQVANVITYRPRSAVRDVGKALGYAQGTVDGWSRRMEPRRPLAQAGPDGEVPAPVLELAARIEGFPRRLGVHSGGMVICDRPVVEVCPVEWARAPGRTVLQWDKEDCAAVGLVKFDLLGLGMLEALHRAVDLVAASGGPTVDLAELPQEPEVYDMLCAADTVGVFQVESRAQMGTLPRLRPRCFYDLVIEVALIRPGPIQ